MCTVKDDKYVLIRAYLYYLIITNIEKNTIQFMQDKKKTIKSLLNHFNKLIIIVLLINVDDMYRIFYCWLLLNKTRIKLLNYTCEKKNSTL